ncbi:MAG TPA: hypothetical protein VIP82_13310 [Microbacterium sp.]|jgi:hypothetical protein|uniref:hypothetical protein n=1 Tax=Microbacterium sp. TaxID=51671 RepID=UPI002F923198
MTSIDETLAVAALTDVVWDHDDDVDFSQPFVDLDQWRDSPVRHRYVHGGFTGTDTRFSLYLPGPDAYEGRFFQHVTPVPQSENLAQVSASDYNPIAFAVDSGAYFVESNGGGPDAANPFSGTDQTIGAYRANAAVARFSRHVAQQVYGRRHRPYGYLYGGSGGAYRTIGSSENTSAVWDGFVPYVPGSPMSIPNVFSVRMHAQRILRDRFSEIVDAYDVGGDPASLVLTDEESAALEEVTRMGFPPRSWFAWKTMGMHAFSVLYPGVMAADPTYADEFWSVDGYLGAEHGSSVHRDRVRSATTVAQLVGVTETRGEQLTAGGVDESFLHSVDGQTASAIRLAHVSGGWMLGAQLVVGSGAAAGSVIRLSGVDGDLAHIEPGQDAVVSLLGVGDEVVLDNSSFLAVQTYHRHQVPGPEYAVWDQFRDDAGHPLLPQRPMLLGPMFTQHAAGTVPAGQISGKMIAVACLLDREAFPWQADWYRARVSEHLGDATDDRFRLWYVDNALHGDDDPQEFPDRSVAYLGVLETALRQLAAWVEDGVEPASTSTYTVTDGQVVIPEAATERGGVQPVVTLTVNGESNALARLGEPVVVRISAEAVGDGVVVEVRPVTGGVLGEPIAFEPAASVAIDHEVVFDEPGTHFVAVRVSAQTAGDADDPHARAQNIGRARITVTA